MKLLINRRRQMALRGCSGGVGSHSLLSAGGASQVPLLYSTSYFGKQHRTLTPFLRHSVAAVRQFV